MTYQLKVVDPITDKRWDQFVSSHPSGLIYHHSAWAQVLQATFKQHTGFYIALENPRTDRFEGILPFMRVKSWLTGRRLVSLPFTAYCPKLIPPHYLDRSVSFALKQNPGAEYLQFRDLYKPDLRLDPLHPPSYCTHLLDLDTDYDRLLRRFHKTSVSQRIRRAKRSGLKFRMSDREEDLKRFFGLYKGLRRRRGLPPQPFSWFVNMWRLLKPLGFLSLPLIEYDGRTIASAVVLHFNDTVHLEYSASDQRFHPLSPNQMLIWETIKRATEAGAKTFDFGRTEISNDSLIDFKSRWAAKKYVLNYEYYPIRERPYQKRTKNLLYRLNRHLPTSILELQGRILYRHLS